MPSPKALPQVTIMKHPKNSGRLPAFQFYPADWRKDPSVQSLDYETRGVWFEMLCLMHESDERGVLMLNGQPMPIEALGRLLGLDNQNLTTHLTKLLTYGVARRREADGAIFNKRMVNDEKLRQVRINAGKQGGNPLLLNQNATTQVKQNPTPSSSSSASISLPLQDKPARKTQKVKAADPRHTEIIRIYSATWQEYYGDKYPFTPRDAKALQSLLPQTDKTPEEFSKIARWCWEQAASNQFAPGAFRKANTLHGLCENFGAILSGATTFQLQSQQ